MMNNLFGMMFMAGAVIGGVWMLSKRNGGKHPLGIAVQNFVVGLRGEVTPSPGTRMTSPPPHVEVMSMQSLEATSLHRGSPSRSLPRPGKALAVIVMALAIAYAISPLDLVPDLVPLVCHIDDAAVLAAAAKYLRKAFA